MFIGFERFEYYYFCATGKIQNIWSKFTMLKKPETSETVIILDDYEFYPDTDMTYDVADYNQHYTDVKITVGHMQGVIRNIQICDLK